MKRPSYVVQFVAALSLMLLPWVVLLRFDILWPAMIWAAMWWMLWLALAAAWHRNLEEDR